MFFWYLCDGNVEEYCDQVPRWDNSLIVRADTPEDALIKALFYYSKDLVRQGFSIVAKL